MQYLFVISQVEKYFSIQFKKWKEVWKCVGSAHA